MNSVWYLVLCLASQTFIVNGQVYTWPTLAGDDTSPVSSPKDLGRYDTCKCIGDISKCTQGLTVALWIKRRASPKPKFPTQNGHEYIISSGGQSFQSDGFYVRENFGEELEIGVARKENVWKKSFNVTTGNWIFLAFTWNEGLTVYIDGQPVASSSSTPDKRPYQSQPFDPFPEITIGKSNDGSSAAFTNYETFGLEFHERRLPAADILNKLKNGKTKGGSPLMNLLRLGCTTMNLGPVTVPNTDKINCKVVCKSMGLRLAAFNPATSACICSKSANEVALKTCTAGSNTQLELYAVSNYLPESHDFDVILKTKMATGKAYLQPGETVMVSLQVSTIEQVVFTVEFGDGNTTITMSDYVDHSYAKVGDYDLTVTAAVRKAQKKVTAKVQVIEKNEGSGPGRVRLSSSQTKFEKLEVQFCVTAFGSPPVQCLLNFGDENNKVGPAVLKMKAQTTALFTSSATYTYPKPGFYPIVLNCSNTYGSKVYKTEIVVRSRMYLSVVKGDNDRIPIAYQERKVNNDVKVMEGSRTLKTETFLGTTMLGMGTFGISQDYLVNVVSGKITLLRYIVKRHGRIASTLTTGKVHGQPADAFNFTESVIGDHIFGRTIFGSDETVYYYIRRPKIPTKLPQSHTYKSLGYYHVQSRHCNRLGCADTKTFASVENRIKKVSSSVTDIKAPGQVKFMFIVNPSTSTPVDRVHVNFDFGDGQKNSSMMLNPLNKAAPLYAFHTYGVFGMFLVKARLYNNISQYEVSNYVQVGENLTNVDLSVENNGRMAVGGEVKLWIAAPTGSTPVYTVDLGEKGMQPLVIREGPQRNSLPRVEMHSTGNISVTTKYGAKGDYTVSVKVQNKFGSVVNSLCPPIIIEDIPSSSCKVAQVSLHGVPASGLLKKTMSENITVIVNTTVMCPSNPKVTYTWKWYSLFKENNKDIIRPLLTPCRTKHHNATLYLKPLTLSYGRYKATVCVGLAVNELLYKCKSFEVEVSTSALRSKIPELNFVEETGTVHFNITGSGDPDIKPPMVDESVFRLICYKRDSPIKILQSLLDDFMKNHEPVFKEGKISLFDYMSMCFPENINFTANGLILSTSPSFLNTDDSYVIRLMVSKGRRQAEPAEQKLKIIKKVTASDLADAALVLKNLDGIDDVAEKCTMVGKIADTLNGMSQDKDDEEAEDSQTELRGQLINVVSKSQDNIKSPAEMGTMTGAMKSLVSNEDQLTPDSKDTAGASVMKAAKAGASMLMDEKASVEDSTKIGEDIFRCSGSLIPKKSPESDYMAYEKKQVRKHRRKRRALDLEDVPDIDVKPKNCAVTKEDYEILTDKEKKKCFTLHPVEMMKVVEKRKRVIKAGGEVLRKKSNKLATNCQEALKNVGDVFGSKFKKEKVEMKSPSLQMSFISAGAPGLPSNIPAGLKGANVQIAKMTNCPFFGEDGGVGGGITAWDFRSKDGKDVQVKGLSEEESNLIVMATEKPAPAVSSYSVMTSLTLPKFNTHKVILEKENQTIRVIFHPENVDDHYKLCLVYEEFPNETNVIYCETLPKEPFKGDLGDILASDATVTEADIKDQWQYTFTPPPRLTGRNGTYRYSVNLSRSVFSLDDTDEQNHTYTIQSYITGCRYWNTSKQQWLSDGCTLLNETTWKHTFCRCNHLTAFGSDFVVPPNTIDFNNVWAKFKDLHENAAVFGTVVSILILYVIALIWARRKDKQDIVKWGAHPLEDNLPSDSYHYQLAVHTGMRKGAGTKSRVRFILSGDESDTGVREMYDGHRTHFRRGTVMNFILSVEQGLGPLTFLRIWHDNNGKGKLRSWYLNQIQVTDLQTGDKYFFLNDRWLAVEEDDGMVERIIPVAGYSDMAGFSHLFNSSVRKKLTNEHIWFSVISRPTRSSFTRCQRLSCCLSLLFLTMITNCMWFKSDDRVEKVSAIKLGPFSFTLHQLFISTVSTLIVFPVNLLMVTIFRKCKAKTNTIAQKNQSLTSKKHRWKAINPGSALWTNADKAKSEKFKDSLRKILFWKEPSSQSSKYASDGVALTPKKKKQPFMFPYWFLYGAWILCFLSVVGSAFFTILYSMEWGKEKAEEWLSTFVLSFFQSVIVVQPIKVLLLAAFISFILRKPELDDDEPGLEEMNNMPGPDEEPITKSRVDLDKIILQRRHAAMTMRPPDLSSLQEARELRVKEIKMEGIIKEMVAYFFFIVVVFFLSYQTRSTDSYPLGSTVRNLFLDGFTPSNHQGFWRYLNTTFVSNLYAPFWYNGKVTDWRERLCINDGNYQTIRVGAARLRQMRIKENTCKVEEELGDLINHCRDSYNWADDDTKPYLPGWRKPPPENVTTLKKEDTPWVYKSALKLKNTPFMAKVSVYKGGGYTRNLGNSKEETRAIIQELYEANWVDARTRAVFIEFTLYNGNVNLFASVVMVAEFMSAGGLEPFTEYKIFRLYSYVGGFGVVVLVAEIIFACFVVYFFFRESNTLRKERLRYFKDFWNMMEFITLVGAVTCVAMYIMKKILGSVAVDALKDSGLSDFVNFQAIALWDELYSTLQSTLVFIATVKFIKILKFNRRMGMLGSTLKQAAKDLKVFIIAFFIYFFAFCQFAYLLFGKTVSKYENFVGSCEALFAFALGDFDFAELHKASPILGPFFFFLYVGVVYFCLMAIFLTIINDAFAMVKQNTDLQSNDYEMVSFMVKRFKGLFGISEKQKRTESEASLDDDESSVYEEDLKKK